MFNFSDVPFFDNHTHRIDPRNQSIKPLDLAVAFMHGWGDCPPEDQPINSANADDCSEEYAQHVLNMGVYKTLVHLLSRKFSCPPTSEAVIAERNKRTSVDAMGYARELYQEARVIAEMVDDGAPMNDSALDCFPTRILRLFQVDPLFKKLLSQCNSYEELAQQFEAAIRDALSQGFIGIKCHVLEVIAGAVRAVETPEAEAAFAAAKAGDVPAWETVYLAAFERMLILSQQLDFYIHIHTGCTGNAGNGLIFNCDPIHICPLMTDRRYFRSQIVFLHGCYPDIRHAALLAHSYPNVWVDLSWTTPWISLNFSQCLEETIAIAPHDKIMLGTGQHNWPEMIWMAAQVSKRALERVMEDAVTKDMISVPQAQETAEQILYKNAVRLYKL